MPLTKIHFCVICDSWVPGFKHGNKSNDRKFCPKCRSKGRYRLIWLYLLWELGIDSKRTRLLHLAPERSLRERLLNLKGLIYMTADIMAPNVDVQLDLTRAGLSNQVFDLILCNHVLEHIEEDGLALEELYRVLRKGGELLLTVSTNKGPFTETYHFTQAPSFSSTTHKGHYREYGLDLADKLSGVGFSVEVVRYMKQFTPQEVHRLGLKNEVFFICRRK